jgi:hypothetical protein
MKAIEEEFDNKSQKDLYRVLKITKPGLSNSLFESRCTATIMKEIENIYVTKIINRKNI